MRITQGGMAAGYTAQLQRNLKLVNSAMNRVLNDGRIFDKPSENVSAAARYRVMKTEFQQNEVYISNVKTARNIFDQGNEVMLSVSKLLDDATGNIVSALDGVKSEDECGIIAEQLRNIQEQIVADLNTQYAGRYLFNGAVSDEKPFELTDDGRLLFRTLDVSDPNNVNALKTMAGETFYMDIGLGLQVTGGNVVPGTAFDTAFSSLNIFGYGEDAATGFSNNLVVLLGQIADALEDPSMTQDDLRPMKNLFENQHQNFLVSMTAVNAKAKYLEVSETRLTNTQLNLQTRMNEVAYMTEDMAATEFNLQYLSYQSALKVGSTLLSQSLIDYLF